MKQEFKELDVSKIQKVSFDTEIPVHNNCVQTKRPLCVNFPENEKIVEHLEAIFNSSKPKECDKDLFDISEYNVLKNVEELKKYLSELLIRFDTNPDNYTKDDYLYLLTTLYKSLLYFYNKYTSTISVNGQAIEQVDNNTNIQIETGDPEHLDITTSEEGVVNIKPIVGEMNTPSTKIATINDIRNYIENRLAWQVVNQ